MIGFFPDDNIAPRYRDQYDAVIAALGDNATLVLRARVYLSFLPTSRLRYAMERFNAWNAGFIDCTTLIHMTKQELDRRSEPGADQREWEEQS